MTTPVKPKPKQPSWWSPRAGVWIAFGFAAVAAVPYLSSATKLMAEGKPVSIEEMKKDVEKEKRKHEEPDKVREVKAFVITADGTAYAGGKAGLFQREGATWKPVAGYPGRDVKALAITTAGEMLAVEEKITYQRGADGAWSTSHEGEAFTVVAAANGDAYLTLKKGGGVLRRAPGGKWEQWADALPVSEAALKEMKEHHDKHEAEHPEKKDMEKKKEKP